LAVTSFRDPHIPCPQSAIMLPEPHEGHAVPDSKRQMALNSLNPDENVRAGIVIGFQKTIPESGCEFHTNAELPFGVVGFQFRHQLGIESHRGVSPIPPKPRGALLEVDRSWRETQPPSHRPWRRPGGRLGQRLALCVLLPHASGEDCGWNPDWVPLKGSG
jgi:hypothetical protein